MKNARVTVPTTGYIGNAYQALLKAGWTVETVPQNGRIKRNGQLVRLKWDAEERAYRLFIYKVTDRGEFNRLSERRIEITSTYQKNLVHDPAYKDVVLGYSIADDIFVGIDPRRINLGGPTGNASSNVSPEGLAKVSAATMLVLPHQSASLGSEFQAYFKPARLAEYLTNVDSIHSGSYDNRGSFSGQNARIARAGVVQLDGNEVVLSGPQVSIRQPIWADGTIWREFERGDLKALKKRKTAPVDFLELYKRQLEIGQKGEMYALKHERQRLIKAKRADLAARIDWVSQDRPYEGYDISSFKVDGSRLYIEVKATTGAARQFPISKNEWSTATDMGSAYVIYRVTNVEVNPAIVLLHDPAALVASGTLRLMPKDLLIKY